MPALFGRWQVLQNHALFQKTKAAGRANEKGHAEVWASHMALISLAEFTGGN
jgi:hypothetical protein